MINKHENGAHVIFADDLVQAVRFIETTARLWTSAWSESNTATAKWDLGVGFEGAKRLARDGWREGAAEALKLIGSIPPYTGKTVDKFDVAGERVDIGRYLAGEPAHMRSKRREIRKRPIIHIVVSMAVSVSVNASDYMRYGAALASVIDNLETRGKRVHLDIVMGLTTELASSYKKSIRHISGWTIKRAEEPMDIESLIFSLSHPAANRRLGYALSERSPKDYERRYWGYPVHDPRDAARIGAPDAFFISGLPPTNSGMPEVVKFATEQVNKAAGQEIVTWES